MKTIAHTICLAVALLAFSSSSVLAQYRGFGEATIYATNPKASETGPSAGSFTIVWTAGTNFAGWRYGLRVFYTIEGTAANGLDYTNIPGVVLIPLPTNVTAETSISVTVPIVPINDTWVEGEETVVLRLFSPILDSQPPYNIGSASNAVVTISDDDAVNDNRAPAVEIGLPTNGAVFTAPADIGIFALANDPDGSVETVEFFAGTRSLGIATNTPFMSPINPLRVLWTNVPMGSYTLTAVATDNKGLAAGSVPVRITVNEAPRPERPVVTIVATDSQAAEISPVLAIPPNPAIFTISRTGSNTLPLVVHLTVGGTALNGTDYDAISNDVVIPAGTSSVQVAVFPIDDLLPEPTESVILSLRPDCTDVSIPGPDCYVLGTPREAIAYILDNEVVTNRIPVVTVAATDQQALEIPLVPPESDQVQLFDPGVFTITRSVVTSLPLTVRYTISGTASNGIDYDYLSNAVTIPANAASAEIVVAPIDDLLPEPTETVVLRLEDIYCAAVLPPPPGCYSVGSNKMATVFIRDNDTVTNVMPVVEVVATDAQGSEIPVLPPAMGMPQRFDPAIFTVTRMGPTNLALPVYYRLGGTALNGVDYEYLTNTVRIPAGARSAQVVVAPIDDFMVEPTESVTLTLLPPACVTTVVPLPPECYVLGTRREAVAHILDNDYNATNVPPVVTIVASDADAGEAGPDTGAFTVSRTGATDAPLSVFYYAYGAAQNGIDYLRLSNFVVIPAGSATAEIVITPIDDTLFERAETVVVQLRPAMVPYPSHSNIVVWPTPYVIGSPSNAVVTITDNDVAGTNLPPTVRIGTPSEGAIFRTPVDIRIVADARDLDGFVRSVEFFEGTNSLGMATNIPANVSPTGLWLLTWSNVPVGRYTLRAQAVDDDGAGSVSAPVHISVVSTNPPSPPTNTIPLVSIAAIDSVACEGRFDFPTTVIVQSNRLCASAVGLTCTSSWVRLDGSNCVYWTNVFCGTNTATFEVRRSCGTNELTVCFSIEGTASNGIDYVALPATVTIPAGRKAARLVVVPIDDNLLEYNETVIVSLILPPPVAEPDPAPYRIGSPSRAAAVIIDNEYTLPRVRTLADGSFHVFLPVNTGSGFRVECSSDLYNWTTRLSNIAIEDGVHYIDPDASSSNVRFYRLVPEPAVMPEE